MAEARSAAIDNRGLMAAFSAFVSRTFYEIDTSNSCEVPFFQSVVLLSTAFLS
jgi:hypothetical protein